MDCGSYPPLYCRKKPIYQSLMQTTRKKHFRTLRQEGQVIGVSRETRNKERQVGSAMLKQSRQPRSVAPPPRNNIAVQRLSWGCQCVVPSLIDHTHVLVVFKWFGMKIVLVRGFGEVILRHTTAVKSSIFEEVGLRHNNGEQNAKSCQAPTESQFHYS